MLTRGKRLIYMAIAAAVAATWLHAQSGQPGPAEIRTAPASLDYIVSNMEQARVRNKESMRSYVVTREYKLFEGERQANDPEQKPSSSVVANVQFVPPDQKTFQIQTVEGSERGKNIVQHVLEGESAKSGKGPAALNRENYEFTLIGDELLDGQPCWILGVKPRHDDKSMIKGRAWVDKNTYLVRQVQGEMAKTPSWWLKKVDMTVRFGDADGMWLPTGTYAVADVRFFGRHVLTSQALEIRTDEQVATALPSSHRSEPARPQVRTYPPMIGAGVYVRH